MKKPGEYFDDYKSKIKNYLSIDNWLEQYELFRTEELTIIKNRREKVKIRQGNPENDAVGLALSGGGVRSASFNLGLLQALHAQGFLKWIDYLSTVSGGGYIGSSLSWFLAQNNGKFPFSKTSPNNSDNRPLRWLRRHANYLCPGDGLDLWALFAAILRGVFINFLIIIPIFFTLTYFLSWNLLPLHAVIKSWPGMMIFSKWPRGDFFFLFFCTGILMLIILLLFFFMYAVLSRIKPIPFLKHRKFSVQYGWFLKSCTLFIVLGLLPVISNELTSQVLKGWQAEIFSSFSVTGIISFLAGWIGMKDKDATRGIRAYLLRIGLTLVIFVLLLIAYRLSIRLHAADAVNILGFDFPMYFLIGVSTLFSLIVGYLSDINHVSMHHYYRNRLLEAYMPKFVNNGAEFTTADNFYLSHICINDTGAPYHIVNANLNTTGSNNPKLRLRGGENFIFSPKYVGSNATGYQKTEDYIHGEMSLATAFSISGAAVDPNTGVTRSRPLAFIMTLLNVRLGYWLMNPKRYFIIKTIAPPFWHVYAFKEMLGWGMNEDNSYIHVSDGGHFENLGLYELVRRKCPYIIVSDAGEDPDFIFKDLAQLCELVRVDFNAEVDIDTKPLWPDKDSGYSGRAFVTGTIKYMNEKTGKYDKTGKIIYVKTTVIEDHLPEDIYGYKRAHKNFPDESTANQFFDETQFEAYRELGYRIGENILKRWKPGKLDKIFSR